MLILVCLQDHVLSSGRRGDDLNGKIRRPIQTAHPDLLPIADYQKIRLHHGPVITVQLHVKNKDLSKAIEYANQQAQTPENLSTLVEINSAEGQNGMVKKYVEWFYAGIDATSDVAEKDVTLKVTKGDDGTWNVDDDSIKELVTATYGGMSLGE